MRKIAIAVLTVAMIGQTAFSQTANEHVVSISLEEALTSAREKSVYALEAKNAFISTYWAYRAYKASRLPSLILYGGFMNFDRSMVLLQSYEDGSLKYLNSYNLQNSLGLQVSQNISFTGGTLKLYSDLSRIDQFGKDKNITWYSQPLTLSYRQPLFAYNQFKWDKLIEPKNYEKGRKTYLEAMEDVNLRVVIAYHNLMKAYKELEVKKSGRSNAEKMYEIALQRLKTGSVTKAECLQMELRILTDSIAVNEASVSVREAQMALNSLTGFDAAYSVLPVVEDRLPDLILNYDKVLEMAAANSSFMIDNEIKLLSAKADVAKAKADRNISMEIGGRFGLTKNAPDFGSAYTNPLDQEVIGLSFSVPIFDWGLGKGKIQKAVAAEAVVNAQIIQSENDFKRQVFNSVGQFNNQKGQCEVSRRASEIALERYKLVMERFRNGSATVTELTDALNDSESSSIKYIEDLSNYWKYYYTLRKLTLFDFMGDRDIEIREEEMIE